MQTDIPSGWRMRKLGELSSFQNGAAFKPTEWSQSGKPIIRIQNLNGGNEFNYYDGEIDKKFGVSDGDLLFCWSGSRGTSFGPRYWHGPNGWLNQHIFNCHPAVDVSKEYLYFLLDQLTLQIEMQAHGGAGLVHIKKSELVKFEYAIPELTEQQRIAEILTSVDDSIRATEAVIAQAERVKRGLMEDLLTGGLGSEAIARGKVPLGWRRTSLSDLCIVQSGAGFPHKQQGINGERYPFYKVSDMNTDGNEVFMTKANNTVSEAVRVKLGAKVFPAGSIIFPKIGAAIATNKKRIITVDSLVDNNVMGLIPKTDQADRSYVYYFMLMKNLSDFASSAGVPSMRKSTVEECPICVPLVEEQRTIAKTLESMDEQIAGNLKTVNQLQRLKRGFMDDLLSGRVRTV